MKKYLRLAKGIVLIGIYLTLYYPAVLAEKFSDWFWSWDLKTFGW